jgi:osmotically-inducible protein OsmY
MEDKKLRKDIIDALDWDPSVDSANIGVAVDDGVATLSGAVPNYAQKLAAQRIAQRVRGVTAIADEIEVRYPGSTSHTDADIAQRAVQVLDWDIVLPDQAVKVKVSKGYVTLTGEVHWDYQRRSAEADVRKLAGVIGVINKIELRSVVSPADVSKRIKDALKRDAEVEAANIHISVADGKVRLDGKVHSLPEQQAIYRAVWSAPGVRLVENHVHVG